MSHPIQDVTLDSQGVYRFKENTIVNFMVDKLKSLGFDLNDLHMNCYKSSPEDWDQFNQLIGYSVSGLPAKKSYDAQNYAQEKFDALKDKTKENVEAINLNSDKDSHYEDLYLQLKKELVEPMARLFEIHPSDLSSIHE